MGAAEVAPSYENRRRHAGAKLGRYQVGTRLGVGGSAAVYLGRLPGPMNFERLVAIKVVHDHLSEEKEFISQFLDEANLLVRLAHPNIVQVHELGREGDTLFLAMEYLHGQPLSKLISSLARRSKRLDPVLVAWLGAKTAEGLGFAHDLKDEQGQSLGLVHRDISPQNVFINYDGSVKLIDFGIARAAGRIAQTTLGRVKGKFSYMAPEQVLGKDFDHRVDLFALGATLYEAALGSRLFAGVDESETLHKLLFEEVPDPRSRVPGFPDELAEILKRALQTEPEKRYQTAAELARDLDAFVKAAGIDDPQQQLADSMHGLFEQERGEQQKSIESLRSAGFETVTERELPVEAGRPSGVISRPAPPQPQLWKYAALGFAIVLTTGVTVLAVRSNPTPAPGPAPSVAVPSTVSIEVTTQPEASATILVAGIAAQGKPARSSVRRGSAPVEVEVTAEGFERAVLTVIPDRDRGVVVPLKKIVEAPPTPPPSASAEKPAKPEGKAGPQAGTPIKKNDPLVTKYPFGK